MFSVAVVGHSLVPVTLDPIEGVTISIYRKPGATWLDYNCPAFRGMRENYFDLIIIILGGNDIAQVEASTAIARAKSFINRAQYQARFLRVFTAETRTFVNPRVFGVSNAIYTSRRNRYNRQLRRWMRSVGQLTVDIGRPWIIYNRSLDGVHLNETGRANLARSITRTVWGVKLSAR